MRALDGLTPREGQVLEMIARGLTNGQVAKELDVSVHAVKFHLSSVYRKLEVGNRTEAAVAFQTHELELERNGSTPVDGEVFWRDQLEGEPARLDLPLPKTGAEGLCTLVGPSLPSLRRGLL